MFWQAGQARIARESRDRLIELYVGARDGYLAGEVALRRAKLRGSAEPSYVRRAQAETTTRRSPAVRDRALAKLATMFPGMVSRGDDA